jgi:hypothetical protein
MNAHSGSRDPLAPNMLKEEEKWKRARVRKQHAKKTA